MNLTTANAVTYSCRDRDFASLDEALAYGRTFPTPPNVYGYTGTTGALTPAGAWTWDLDENDYDAR
jgi:hypothetical protein